MGWSQPEERWFQVTGLPEAPFTFSVLVQELLGGYSPVLDRHWRWLAYTSEKGICILDLRTSQIRQILPAPKRWITFGMCAFSPDGHLLAAPLTDGSVRVWEVATGREVHVFTGPPGIIHHLAFSPDGNLLAAPGASGEIRVWEVSTGQEVLVLQDGPGTVIRVAFSPDGRYLASANWLENRITLWDVFSGQKVWSVSGHRDTVFALEFSPVRALLASGSGDGAIRLWDVSAGKEVGILLGHTGPVFTLAFRGDGRFLASGGKDLTIRLWDLTTGQQVYLLDLVEVLDPFAALVDERDRAYAQLSYVARIAISADGKLLASGLVLRWEGQIHLWHVAELWSAG